MKKAISKKSKPSAKGMHKMPGGSMMKNSAMKKAKSGGSFPDLNKDGKVTKADVLVGRGVIKAKKGVTVKKAKFGDFLKKAVNVGMKVKGAADSIRGSIGNAMGIPGGPMFKKGGKATKKPTMKSGGKMGKCKYGCN